METKKIVVHDPLQRGYTYVRSAPSGKKFDAGFMPELTPKEMLELGVFGGDYFEGEIDEYPMDWFKNEKTSTNGKYDASLNFFSIRASQSREEWERKGWIHPEDPRGWFQWYCRYYLGRRNPTEDARQIERFKKIVRHLAQIKYNCRPKDFTCRPRQRQAVLHWAYDSRVI